MNKFKFGDKVKHRYACNACIFVEYVDDLSAYSDKVARVLYDGFDGFPLVYESDLTPVSEWIPCSERMPDFGVDVLITNGISCCVDSRVKRCFIDDSEWSFFRTDATHWMPLPSPPTE